MAESETTYNLKAVVQQTGIPAASLRAWERRYGILNPIRKPNGHRVYPASEVAKLLRIKALMAQGMTISQAADQVRNQTGHSTPVSELERLRTSLTQALEQLDGHQANRIVAEALELLSVDQFCLRIIRPMLPNLTPFGRTYLRTRLGSLVLYAPSATEGPTALVINPDPLDLQPLLVAVFLSRRGRHVIYIEGDKAPEGVKAEMVVDPRQWKGGVSPEHLFG